MKIIPNTKGTPQRDVHTIVHRRSKMRKGVHVLDGRIQYRRPVHAKPPNDEYKKDEDEEMKNEISDNYGSDRQQ